MAPTPLLKLRGISKSFGAVQALVDVDFELNHHEVVALVGDNAAGKSTLARIIAGVHEPDAGILEIDGAPVRQMTTADARAHGIATVFQNLALAENLDVTANIYLGQEVRTHGLLDEDFMESTTRDYLQKLNSRIPSPRMRLSELTAGQRQCVAIARTLVGNPRIIVLDEPTSSLSVIQTSEVLNHVSRLRSLGLGVVLISHALSEIQAVADRIEVLRHGRNNGSFPAADTAYEDILAAVSGATSGNLPRT